MNTNTMKYILSICLMLLIAGTANAQTDTLPYYQIPDAPSTYTAATVSARMIDGLGYRYYWATESLRPEDLAYEPGLIISRKLAIFLDLPEMWLLMKLYFEEGSKRVDYHFGT